MIFNVILYKNLWFIRIF